VEVRDDAGRDLQEEAGGLEDGADEDHLQRGEADDGEVVDLAERGADDEEEGHAALEQVVDGHRPGRSQRPPEQRTDHESS
jgi:hypothetical protein